MGRNFGSNVRFKQAAIKTAQLPHSSPMENDTESRLKLCPRVAPDAITFGDSFSSFGSVFKFDPERSSAMMNIIL